MSNLREVLKKHDKGTDSMKNASKEAWECKSYQEWLASLPEEEQEYEDSEDN